MSNVWSNWSDYTDQIIPSLISEVKSSDSCGQTKDYSCNQSRKWVLWDLEFTWMLQIPVPWLLLWVPRLLGEHQHASTCINRCNYVLISCSSSHSKSFGAGVQNVQMLSFGVKKWHYDSENVAQLNLVRISSEALHSWLVSQRRVPLLVFEPVEQSTLWSSHLVKLRLGIRWMIKWQS